MEAKEAEQAEEVEEVEKAEERRQPLQLLLCYHRLERLQQKKCLDAFRQHLCPSQHGGVHISEFLGK